MIWDRDKLRENYGKQIPLNLFADTEICPLCSKKIKGEKEKLSSGKNPYMRFFNKFYWIHKDCFYTTFEGMLKTVKENKDEYMVDEL